MKDFSCRQTIPSEWKNHVLWRDDVSRSDSTETRETFEKPELKNPLKFGAKDLRAMEANIKTLTPEQKRDFQDMAGYFLSLKQKLGSKNLPPHMLVQIEQSPLFALLSQKMQEQIRNALDSQIDELADFSQKSFQSPATVVRASLLYRRLRSRAKKDPRLNFIFEDVQKNLLGWALERLRKGSVSAKVRDALKGESDSSGIELLTSQEKLIIASIYRMFPDSKDWVDYCDVNVARQFAKEAVMALKENPSDPTLVTGWSFIDEWMANGESDIVEALHASFSRKEIEQFIGRARSVELLQFARKESPFLPVHFRALQSLQEEEAFLPQTVYLADFAPEEIKIRELDKEAQEVKQKYENSKVMEVERCKKENPNSPEVLEYQNIFQKKKELEEEMAEKERILIEKFADKKLPEGASDEQKEEFVNLQADIDTHKKEILVEEKNEEDAIAKMPFSKVFAAKQEAFKKQREELEKAKSEFEKQLLEREDWCEIYNDAQKNAEKAVKNFWDGIQHRLDAHALHAADFEMLWNDEFETEIQENIQNRPEKEKIDRFRSAFEKALEGIFSELSLADDRYENWYQALDEQLSYDNLIERLKQQGFDLRKEFQHPQQLSEVLEGAIGKYRTNIFEQVQDRIDSEHRDAFYSGWDRLHGHLSVPIQDPTIVAADHSKYEFDKLNIDKKIQEEQEKTLTWVNRLREQAQEDPALAETYNQEADKIEQSWETRKQWYSQGGRMEVKNKEGKEEQIWVPGKTLLTEMAFQTRSIEAELRSYLDGAMRTQFLELREGFTEARSLTSEAEKKERYAALKEKMNNIFTQWPGVKNEIRRLIGDHQSVLKGLLPEDSNLTRDFVKYVYNESSSLLKAIDTAMSDFQKHAQSCDYKYYGDEVIFLAVPKAIQQLTSFLDFNQGRLAKDSEKLDAFLEKDTETVAFLNEKQFFADNTEEKKNFRKKYEEMREDFRTNMSRYATSIRSVQERIHQDKKKLNDEEFALRYGGLTFEYMENILQSHTDQIEDFNKGGKDFLEPSFFDTWVKQYNKSPETRANALAEMTRFRNVVDWSSEAQKRAKSMEEWISEWEKSKPQVIRKYQSFSLYDIYALVKQTIEVHNRRWERQSEKAIANMGLSFFGKGSPWGKEFYRKAQETEEARVKEFETQYDEDPWWDTQQVLYETNNQDEAKACIRLLIDKGVFRWDDPKLWKTLMRLSSNAVYFGKSDMNLDMVQILEKCKSACEFIWSKETFRQWDTSLESKIKSKEDEFTGDFQRYESDPNARIVILQTMIKNWSQGNRANSDPAKYGLFLRKSFEQGKLNGGPLWDVRWYYVIQGVKYGLLSRDFFNRLNGEFLGHMPFFDFFEDKSGWKKDGKLVPAGTPGGHGGGWTYQDYEAWAGFLDRGTSGNFSQEDARKNTKEFFYEVILQSQEARARIDRMVRNGTKTFDHDDAPMFAAGLTLQSIQQMLNTTSTDEDKYTPDFWRGILAGYVPYFEGISKYIREGDQEYGQDNPEWQKIRQRNFTEVADRMRAMVVVSHSLLGNINLTERKSIIFQPSQFDKKEAMSPCARGSFDVSNRLLDRMFKISGTYDEFSDIKDESTWLQPQGAQPPGKESGTASQFEKVKRGEIKANVTTKVFDLTKGPASNVVFTNKNIEKLLLEENIDWAGLMEDYQKKVY